MNQSGRVCMESRSLWHLSPPRKKEKIRKKSNTEKCQLVPEKNLTRGRELSVYFLWLPFWSSFKLCKRESIRIPVTDIFRAFEKGGAEDITEVEQLVHSDSSNRCRLIVSLIGAVTNIPTSVSLIRCAEYKKRRKKVIKKFFKKLKKRKKF